MITPSISFDDSTATSTWNGLSLLDVKEMIRCDVEELGRLSQELAAASEIQESGPRKWEQFRLKRQIEGWERAQDAHWSWYREIQNADTRSTEWPQAMGPGLVGSGH